MAELSLKSADGPVVLESVRDLRAFIEALRAKGGRIAFVPTMGALHEGHLHLMREGLKRADHVIASIFVNPTQFGPNEDFDAYPRTWDEDLVQLKKIGAAAVFHPAAAEMYPQGDATSVHVARLGDDLCGPLRPGHFDGVATVVTKLLLQVMPDIALFGEKDYQQLQVIKRMVTDLSIPVAIEGVATVRAPDGLALSSRNAYLSAQARAVAVRMNEILFALAARIEAGEDDRAMLEEEARAQLLQAGFRDVQYVAIRDEDGLAKPERLAKGCAYRILAAAFLEQTRLIDNVRAVAKG